MSLAEENIVADSSSITQGTQLVLQDLERQITPLEQGSDAAEQLLSLVRDVVFQTAQLPLMTLVYSQTFHQVTRRYTCYLLQADAKHLLHLYAHLVMV